MVDEGIKIVEDGWETGWDSASHSVQYYLGGNLVVTGTVSSSGGGESGPLFSIDHATLDTTAVTTAQSFLFPATGGHLALLDLAQTWSAVQSFTKTDFLLKGTSSGSTTLNSGLTGSGSNILALPITSSDTLAALGTVQTWTAAQSFTASDFLLKGSGAGSTTLNSGLGGAGSNTLTLPITSSDTLAALGTGQMWTGLQDFGDTHLKLGGLPINITEPASAGQALVSDGSHWVNSAYSATLTTSDVNTWAGLQSFPSTAIQFTDNGTLGSKTCLLGSTAPAAISTVGAPSAWLMVEDAAGDVVYIPAWK